ncbi:hypothetical protein BO83DRAFT_427842 [Aspergillus eucalypticola CBS 122712]|uniref:Uncharacterized protein n=1 Tax=Aspergillus eucalypticola (strain CBS 122712 / IBT 29274) TaxID=1448314 RepID=A0A317VAV3_ASPEC|nr:uncharacterized protein BO83DRAFT_427842 [Aspergillus eucalypticola CBS 122712]PWY71225.1 hypothetical protein BO83DRAFT_427842 [Aspergillus eucalypticola CBS 122712]
MVREEVTCSRSILGRIVSLQKHSKRSEESLTSVRRLEPAIHRPRMQDVFNASWENSGADPPLRVGMSLDKAAIDPDYLRDMGFSLPGSVVDSALVADFDYYHTATSLGRSTEGCSCRLCVAVDAVTRPLFARNAAVGDLGNLIVSATVSVDLSLNARATASVKGVPVSNG